MKSIQLDGHNLTLEEVRWVAEDFRKVRLDPVARERMKSSRKIINDRISNNNPIYGVTTGIGKLSDQMISSADAGRLQLNILRSHACGVGPHLEESQVRAAILVRANTLAKGYSGIRAIVVERILELLNRRVYPLIPRQGSVGASGDLIPSAHVGLVLIGEGEALWEGEKVDGLTALQRAGIRPLLLEAKEGISIINGTHFMSGIGVLCLERASRCLHAADVAGALCLEALLGTPVAFDPRLMDVRPHAGQRTSADHLRRLVENSGIVAYHHDCRKVQDAYSLRCMPQIHGAARDSLAYSRGVLGIEINSAVDNPSVFAEEGEILSGGNFHGAPVALALDFLAMALTQAATLSERRLERLINPDLSGLPAFLCKKAGLDSGFMMVQVAAAALASECKVLAHPASADTIPTSASKEDHVSMGMHAALKLADILSNYENMLAMELLAACQAIDLLDLPGRPNLGQGTQQAYDLVRRTVPPLLEDRSMSHDIAMIRHEVRSGAFDAI